MPSRQQERERERESPVWNKMFQQLCGRLGGAAHHLSFRLFNFFTIVVQVSPRCVGIKIKKKFPFYLLR